MHEIKCPHCHTAFTVNEASYADILNQVRTQEFQTEIHERLQQAQMQFQSDMQLAQAQAQNQFDKILADKNHEIAALSNQINAYEKDSKLAAAEIEGRLKAQIAEQDKLIAELKAQAKSLETAKNMEKELEITKAVAEKVERAVKQGATLVCGGKRAEGRGYFFEPTLLTDTDNNMDIMKEETFGPVLPVATFDTLDQVIALANDCEFGLTSSVYTTNLNEAFYVTRRLQFGETYINRENFEAMQGFHAGWKKSGIGGADGKHGLEEYLQTQVVYLETNI